MIQQKELQELMDAGVISPQTAASIEKFYQTKGDQSQNKVLLVFGILGAILVGLGLILIIAHNWDELSRSLKIALAFLPLLLGNHFSLLHC